MYSYGVLEFDPESRAGKRSWWCVLRCCEDLGGYYRYLVNRENRANFQIEKPIWGSHISVIRGEEPGYVGLWGEGNGVILPFLYDHKIETNGHHFWLTVRFPLGQSIRNSVGIYSEPFYDFHLTFGVIRC